MPATAMPMLCGRRCRYAQTTNARSPPKSASQSAKPTGQISICRKYPVEWIGEKTILDLAAHRNKILIDFCIFGRRACPRTKSDGFTVPALKTGILILPGLRFGMVTVC
jgi:hypothetical protein